MFIKRVQFFILKANHFQRFDAISKKEKLKAKFSYNLGQNIFRLFQVLPQFIFTTSETELDYHHQKVRVRVNSQDVKPLKT